MGKCILGFLSTQDSTFFIKIAHGFYLVKYGIPVWEMWKLKNFKRNSANFLIFCFHKFLISHKYDLSAQIIVIFSLIDQ